MTPPAIQEKTALETPAPVDVADEAYALAVVRQREDSLPTEEATPANAAPVSAAQRVKALAQRAATEQARRQIECLAAFQETLLIRMGQPCLRLDREGKVTLWNSEMIRWTTISEACALGQPLEELLPPDYSHPLSKIAEQARLVSETHSTPERISYSGVLHSEDGSETLTYVAVPLLHTPGCAECCVLLLQVA